MKLSLTMLLFCLTLLACRTTKKFQSEINTVRKSDSTVYQEKVKLDTLRAARETVSAAIPFHLLRDSLLPPYEKRNGRATVSIQRVRDSIIISATCDSLEKVVATLEKERYALSVLSQYQERNREEVVIKTPWWVTAGIVAALLNGMLLIVIQILKYFKR